jgi:hypothetical protein
MGIQEDQQDHPQVPQNSYEVNEGEQDKEGNL